MKYGHYFAALIYTACLFQSVSALQCYTCRHVTGVNEQLSPELRSQSEESCKHGQIPNSNLLKSCDPVIQGDNAACATVLVRGNHTINNNSSAEISMVIRDCYSWPNVSNDCFTLPGKIYMELPNVPYICKETLKLSPETPVNVCLCRDSGCNKEAYRTGRELSFVANSVGQFGHWKCLKIITLVTAALMHAY